mgnify:FL=1
MKVNKHLKIDAITNSTGRLPRDMENLEIYHYSSSKKEPINVGEMDLTYLIRAFAKCQRTLQEQSKQLSQEVRIDTQEGKVKDLSEQLMYQEKIIGGLRSEVRTYKEKLEDKNRSHDTQEYHNLHAKISRLEELLEEKDIIMDRAVKSEAAWKDRFFQEVSYKGDRMMFKDIPNDASGRAFVAQLREYLNTDSYKIRVRGQYLIDGEDWRRYSYGQPIEKSKCLRVYVDNK